MEEWRKNKKSFAVFMIPATAWLVLFFTIPIGILWIYSFGERGPQGQTYLAFSFANYARAVEWIHLGILWKSMWMAGVTTVVCILLGFPLALGIAFAPQKYKNPLLLLIIIPFWTNLLIRTYAWIAVLRSKGFLNFGLEWLHDKMDYALTTVGLGGALGAFEPVEFLYNQQAVIVGLVYVYLPFMILPLYASLEKLDKRYLEASLDLGAGHWRTLFSVTVPLISPGIASGVILTFILALGSYLTPNLLGGTDSMMIGNLIAHEFMAARDWPFGSALSFLLMYGAFLAIWLKSTIETRAAAQRERS
jgi:spermidine/putrescine transport system permease protein